jgi:hypothetical protein
MLFTYRLVTGLTLEVVSVGRFEDGFGLDSQEDQCCHVNQ